MVNSCTSVEQETERWSAIVTSRMFVDGVLEDSGTPVYTITANSGSPRPRIGSDSGSAGDFDGNVSNLRIVRGKSLYNTDFTPSKSPLKKVDNTILLCCKNSKSETAEETDKVVIDSGSVGKSSDHPFTLGDGTAKYYYNRRKAKSYLKRLSAFF